MFFFVHDINNRIKTPVKPSQSIKPVDKPTAIHATNATSPHPTSTDSTYPSSPRITTRNKDNHPNTAYSNETITALDIMSSPIVCADRSLTIDEVDSKMDKYETKHIVITNSEGYIEGILTKENLLKQKLQTGGQKSIEAKYCNEIYSTQPLIPASEIASLMLNLKLGAVLVMENDFAIGIITVTNYLEMIALGAKNIDLNG